MMNILLCCEFYAPSIGGVQEVMKQIAERFVLNGHKVTVATRKLSFRNFDELNGVKIVEFELSGNLTYGLNGKLDEYHDFITSHKFDILMIKAAQQCTFDALWPVLDRITAKKIFIPCGFSGLFDPAFADYFRKLPEVLRQFDHLIFYASDYRDINFAREHGINNYSIIPNGASEVEFSVPPDPLFRDRYGIGKDELLFLTVGSFTGSKGHLEVANAYKKIKLDRASTLILNGNIPDYMLMANKDSEPEPKRESKPLRTIPLRLIKATITGRIFKRIIRIPAHMLRAIGIIREETYLSIANSINSKNGNKKVLITDMRREDLVQAFISADLFVFASYIEYSPLVLFEAAAAGTPFLSVPVGNAEEIARWTGAGQICQAPLDSWGNTKVKPKALARHMSRLVKDTELLHQLGENGRKNFHERFTWAKIAKEYENVFESLLSKRTVSK